MIRELDSNPARTGPDAPLVIYGSTASYYTGKLEAYLRAKGILPAGAVLSFEHASLRAPHRGRPGSAGRVCGRELARRYEIAGDAPRFEEGVPTPGAGS